MISWKHGISGRTPMRLSSPSIIGERRSLEPIAGRGPRRPCFCACCSVTKSVWSHYEATVRNLRRLSNSRAYGFVLDLEQMLQELGHSRPHRTETCEILWKTRTFNDTRATPFRPLGSVTSDLILSLSFPAIYSETLIDLADSSVDVWHCYYVYGQDNENSQCRSHWMFDGQLEHIGIVHYRELNEVVEIEVSAETLTNTSMQCATPAHTPANVTFSLLAAID
ncbi:hypothetical protein EUGRSUZ_E00361 [Eucalyptus grandis]|uniref:Uncharacterized protein n=2 Tax=Eucalyptus grandis TaxID=71139 RepID=A0ACC3KRB6_EUCGR|nr:hypothetical protein EUGRSUZ_E00361 [Eucalyptus grandis]